MILLQRKILIQQSSSMAAAAIAEERAEDEPGEHVYVPSAASQSHDASSSPAIAALTPRSSHLALAAGDGRVRIFSTGTEIISCLHTCFLFF